MSDCLSINRNQNCFFSSCYRFASAVAHPTQLSSCQKVAFALFSGLTMGSTAYGISFAAGLITAVSLGLAATVGLITLLVVAILIKSPIPLSPQHEGIPNPRATIPFLNQAGGNPPLPSPLQPVISPNPVNPIQANIVAQSNLSVNVNAPSQGTPPTTEDEVGGEQVLSSNETAPLPWPARSNSNHLNTPEGVPNSGGSSASSPVVNDESKRSNVTSTTAHITSALTPASQVSASTPVSQASNSDTDEALSTPRNNDGVSNTPRNNGDLSLSGSLGGFLSGSYDLINNANTDNSK